MLVLLRFPRVRGHRAHLWLLLVQFRVGTDRVSRPGGIPWYGGGGERVGYRGRGIEGAGGGRERKGEETEARGLRGGGGGVKRIS
jgi:hypothetical protein